MIVFTVTSPLLREPSDVVLSLDTGSFNADDPVVDQDINYELSLKNTYGSSTQAIPPKVGKKILDSPLHFFEMLSRLYSKVEVSDDPYGDYQEALDSLPEEDDLIVN